MNRTNERSERLTEENRQLKKENQRLRRQLEQQKKNHQKWEEIAVKFHDTLWQVLLKYEPETYGKIYPHRKEEAAALNLEDLPKLDQQD